MTLFVSLPVTMQYVVLLIVQFFVLFLECVHITAITQAASDHLSKREKQAKSDRSKTALDQRSVARIGRRVCVSGLFCHLSVSRSVVLAVSISRLSDFG